MTITYYPGFNVTVNIIMTDGEHTVGYWDGNSWWSGVDDNPSDINIPSDYVRSWSVIS